MLASTAVPADGTYEVLVSDVSGARRRRSICTGWS
jgi:hypothetical protein